MLKPQIGFSLVEPWWKKVVTTVLICCDIPNCTPIHALLFQRKKKINETNVFSPLGPNNANSIVARFIADLHFLSQTNLLKDIKTYLKAAANRETELTKKQHELEEKVFYLVSAVKLN